MTIQFNEETFRDDYTFKNSDWAIQRFPFPFHEDSYMYSVNMERHRGGPEGSIYEKRFDVDGDYNVRYEILKKRIDKATINQGKERLTLANMISIVYLHDRDKEEYVDYLDYLHQAGYIEGEIEDLVLNSTPDFDLLSCH